MAKTSSSHRATWLRGNVVDVTAMGSKWPRLSVTKKKTKKCPKVVETISGISYRELRFALSIVSIRYVRACVRVCVRAYVYMGVLTANQ